MGDIMDQISEGGRSIHEIDKIRKRLAAEKSELQGALEEAEGALEQEENKVLRAQIELAQIRKEVDHRIAEKEEQFLGIKKNMTKGAEGMQAALETEAKGKAEALRMKKKLESDVGELEIALEHSNANNVETQKAIKKYQVQIRDAATKLADEQRAGKIVVELNGRLNKCGVISPRFDVGINQIDKWTTNLLPSRQFGFVVLTTSDGIIDHEEAKKKHTGGKILGFFF